MKLKNSLLFISVFVIFVTCFLIINSKFDRLARYPYEDEKARELINFYMSDEDIEYIIDYSLSPEYFIKYIECPDFNIYHVDSYDTASYFYWYAETDNVVSLVEKIYEIKSGEDIDYELSLLKNYHIDEINFYYDNLNLFEGFELAYDPSEFNPDLEPDKTIGNHVPDGLFTNNDITLKEQALNALISSFEEIDETFKCKNYGGIKVLDAYLNFEELSERNAEPGRNIHQFGNSVDLDLTDSIFLNNADYVTMKDIFESHGFEIDECMFSDCHLTFVGINK